MWVPNEEAIFRIDFKILKIILDARFAVTLQNHLLQSCETV